MLADTPEPPYYAVIFSSLKTENDTGYDEMATRMEDLAKKQEGFLGFESSRNQIGITVSYWKDMASIKSWKKHSDHMVAQQKGTSIWYSHYKVRIAKVERDYGFNKAIIT